MRKKNQKANYKKMLPQLFLNMTNSAPVHRTNTRDIFSRRRLLSPAIVFLVLLMVLPVFGKTGSGSQPIHVDAKRLHSHVLALTTIEPPRTYKNRKSLNKAAAYIFEEFKKCGFAVRYQHFTARGNKYKNVVAVFSPQKGQTTTTDKHSNLEHVIIGAHYDVCGEQAGADDNGSGVAALLELAHQIKLHKPKLNHVLELVAYSLEEPPFFKTRFMGSAIHARKLAKSRSNVKLMISVDMVGHFSNNGKRLKPVSDYLESPSKNQGNTTVVAGKNEEKAVVRKVKQYMQEGTGEKLEVLSLVAPQKTKGLDWSDHLNYWAYGFPAVFITNCYANDNPNYHSKKDTIDTLDFPKLAEVVKGLYMVATRY